MATNPIWILVTRMQANKSRKGAGKNNQAGASSLEGEEEEKKKKEGEGEGGESLTLTQTALKLYEESGVLGFWKGVLPSLIMVSNPSIQYMFFETLYNIRSNPKQGKAKTLSAFEVFQTSALAKLGMKKLSFLFQELVAPKTCYSIEKKIGSPASLLPLTAFFFLSLLQAPLSSPIQCSW